jgi:hypothetical protein
MRISKPFIATILIIAPVPAFAGQTSAEFRVSALANNDGAAVTAGVGIGQEWAVGEKMFAGMQAVGEVDTQGGFGLGSVVGKFGPKLGERSRIYALAGGAAFTDYGDKSIFPVAGAGIDVGLGRKMYAKLDYRIYLGSNEPDPEGATGTIHHIGVGIGIRF